MITVVYFHEGDFFDEDGITPMPAGYYWISGNWLPQGPFLSYRDARGNAILTLTERARNAKLVACSAKQKSEPQSDSPESHTDPGRYTAVG